MFEQALHLSVKDDHCSKKPSCRAISLWSWIAPVRPSQNGDAISISVKDIDHLQRTLNTLLTAANFVPRRDEDGGAKPTTRLAFLMHAENGHVSSPTRLWTGT